MSHAKSVNVMNIKNKICVKFLGLDETLGSKHTPFYQKIDF